MFGYLTLSNILFLIDKLEKPVGTTNDISDAF